MRRRSSSVLVRFLGLSLAVALGAVVATAVLATYSTTEQLRGEIDANASQLEVDGEIRAKLLRYAADHPDWSGVDRLVRTLAEQTGRRIALTRPDGGVIADSARALGAGPDLPSMPAATIDARSLPQKGFAAASMRVTGPGKVAAAEPVPFIGAATIGSPYWRLTDSERRNRTELAEKAVGCLRDSGLPAQLVSGEAGVPQVVLTQTTSTAGGAAGGASVQYVQELQGHPCIPAALTAPSALARAVNTDEVGRTVGCLTSAGQPYTLAEGPGRLPTVVPAEKTGDLAVFERCVTEARNAALAPYVAPQARLYLGTDDRFNVFSGDGLVRTGATAFGVLLVAALVTVLVGRRLVRPIVALTGAAQRMTTGDHATRVPVAGSDEVSRLGHAFNTMAESIQRNDDQRKALVGDVAHELRTPLANIKGYLVASEDGVVPLDRALVGSLLEEADLLERLVADLQDLALADAGMLRLHPEPRDLAELVQQVVAAHRPQAEAAGVTLTAEAGGPAVAVVDGGRIRQALGNLVGNAIRFTPPDGRVTVAVPPAPGGAGHDLVVTDTGSGITPEHLTHIFDRFYRVEGSRSRSTGGSGLGLAITKHLVDAHGGSIAVASTPGRGSTFTLHLP